MTREQALAAKDELFSVIDKLPGDTDILGICIEDRWCRKPLAEVFLNGGIREAAAALGIHAVEAKAVKGGGNKLYFWVDDVGVYTYEEKT